MAIKQRKQVTGTTAQINAYAGVEGQLVWDKDKKTLVGMSGTAGTNYPLATAEALSKKENAGVCLPLTGGTMLGDILFKAPNGEFSIGDKAKGARLALNEATREGYEGQAILQASDGTRTAYCNFYPNEELRINGNVVDYIVQKSDGVIRYASGLQIAWIRGSLTSIKNAGDAWGLAYPLPFVGGKNIIPVVSTLGGWAYATTINLESATTTSCSGTMKRTDGDYTTEVFVLVIVFGSWK